MDQARMITALSQRLRHHVFLADMGFVEVLDLGAVLYGEFLRSRKGSANRA
jgi:hypothetical protein